MKKSILAIGLLSMVMVLSSTTNKVSSSTAKVDLKSNLTLAYGGSGNQSGGSTIKLD